MCRAKITDISYLFHCNGSKVCHEFSEKIFSEPKGKIYHEEWPKTTENLKNGPKISKKKFCTQNVNYE